MFITETGCRLYEVWAEAEEKVDYPKLITLIFITETGCRMYGVRAEAEEKVDYPK